MKKYYEVNAKLTSELVEKLDEDSNIFWRFQNPEFEISGEYTESWGMIYGSRDEAIQSVLDYACEYGCEMTYEDAEEEAILPGKSCCETLKEVLSHWDEFGDSDVLMAFYGYDTYVSGHDGESVAEFDHPVAIFSMQDLMKFYDEMHDLLDA